MINFHIYKYYKTPSTPSNNWVKFSLKKLREIKEVTFWIMGFYILFLFISPTVGANKTDIGIRHTNGPRDIKHTKHSIIKPPNTVTWAALGGITIILPIISTIKTIEYNYLGHLPITKANITIDNSPTQFGSGITHRSWRSTPKQEKSHPIAAKHRKKVRTLLNLRLCSEDKAANRVYYL